MRGEETIWKCVNSLLLHLILTRRFTPFATVRPDRRHRQRPSLPRLQRVQPHRGQRSRLQRRRRGQLRARHLRQQRQQQREHPGGKARNLRRPRCLRREEPLRDLGQEPQHRHQELAERDDQEDPPPHPRGRHALQRRDGRPSLAPLRGQACPIRAAVPQGFGRDHRSQGQVRQLVRDKHVRDHVQRRNYHR